MVSWRVAVRAVGASPSADRARVKVVLQSPQRKEARNSETRRLQKTHSIHDKHWMQGRKVPESLMHLLWAKYFWRRQGLV